MKRHVTFLLLTLSTLTLAAATTGCSFGASKEEAPEAAPPTETAAEEETPEEEATNQGEAEEETYDLETMDSIKYNIYVEMNNYMIRVLENIDSYYTVVDYADEFSLLPDSGYSYKYNISSLNSSIIDDAVAVASMEPAYETLDSLAQQIAEPMRALMDTFSDISGSYDFADNQYAKAKEFHTVIQKNAADFEKLAYSFMDEISVIGTERVKEHEQQMLDEGNLIIYNASHMITVTNQLLNECYAQDVYDDNITELDLTPIRPLYEELVATVDAFKEATSDNNQLVKESLSNSTPFDALPDSLVQSVEWMIKQVESQTPINDPGMEYLGGIIHIEKVLSTVIDRYNTVFTE